MNRAKNTGLVLCGLVLGLSLSAPAAQAVESLKATLSTNRILVDGQEVRLTAYNINGNNYVTEAGTPYARKIYSTMKTAINRLRDFPLMGQTHPDPILAANGYRKLVLTKTYVAVYKVIGDTVYIYAIVNGTTDYPRLLK